MAVCRPISTTDVFRIEVAVPGVGRRALGVKVIDFIHMHGDHKWTLKIQRDPTIHYPFDYQVGVLAPCMPIGSAWSFKLYERTNDNDIVWNDKALIGPENGWLVKGRDSSTVYVGAEVTVRYDPDVSSCTRPVKPNSWEFRSSDSMGEFDAVFVVREVYTHRAILSAVSAVFRGMFTTENRDKYELEHQVAAEDATPEEFEAFLRCIYPCGKEPTEQFLVPVAILADYYGVKPLLSTCNALIANNARIPKLEKLRVSIKTNDTELENNVISTFTKEDHRQLMLSDIKEHLGEKRLLKIWEQGTSLL